MKCMRVGLHEAEALLYAAELRQALEGFDEEDNEELSLVLYKWEAATWGVKALFYLELNGVERYWSCVRGADKKWSVAYTNPSAGGGFFHDTAYEQSGWRVFALNAEGTRHLSFSPTFGAYEFTSLARVVDLASYCGDQVEDAEGNRYHLCAMVGIPRAAMEHLDEDSLPVFLENACDSDGLPQFMSPWVDTGTQWCRVTDEDELEPLPVHEVVEEVTALIASRGFWPLAPIKLILWSEHCKVVELEVPTAPPAAMTA